MRCLKLLYIAIVVIISIFSNVYGQTPPAWCNAGQTVQLQPTFSQCSLHSSGPGDVLFGRASWCSKTNFYGSIPISFTDPQLKNDCNNVNAHCVGVPNLGVLDTPVCVNDNENDVIFYPSMKLNASIANANITTYKQKCSVTSYAEPIEVIANNFNHELLFVAEQKGFHIVDMATEKVLTESEQYPDAYQFIKVIPSDATEAFGYVASAQGNNLYGYVISFNANNQINVAITTVQLPGTVLGLTGFLDRTTSTRWVAALVGSGTSATSVIFYQLGVPFGPATQRTWTFPPTTVVGIDSFEWTEYDRTAPQPTNVQCFPRVDNTLKNLVMLYTASDIFIFGFEPNTVNYNNPITLDRTTQIGKALYYSTTSNNVQITAASAFTECFGDFSRYTQGVWLAVSLLDNTQNTVTLQYVGLVEFTEVDFNCLSASDSWWLTPTAFKRSNGISCGPNTSGTQSSCPSPLVQFQTYSNGVLSCVNRPQITAGSLPAPATRIVSRLMTHYNANPAEVSELSYSFVREVFVGAGKNILIFSFQEIVCQSALSNLPKTDIYTTVALDDYIKEVSASANGQHLFVSVYKHDWEIDSNKRFVEICNDLSTQLAQRALYEQIPGTSSLIAAIDASIQYTKQFLTVCQARNPTRFNMYSYINYFSQCNGGWSCPRYGYTRTPGASGPVTIEYDNVPPGEHTIRPTLVFTCEPGFYCPGVNGAQRVLCPVGFKCPTAGMSAPVQCSSSPNYDITCTTAGLATEAPCDPGSICMTATSPPIPAPPGFFTATYSRKNLYQCDPGQYCPLSATSDATNSNNATLCPAGQYCPNPYVMKPIPCTTMYDANNKQIANYSMYCPPGSTFGNACPYGYKCPTTTQSIICDDGYFCPSGTQNPLPCPAGFYCPITSAFLLCPVGYFCRAGTINPVKCQYLVYCPPGTTKPSYALFAILVDVCILAFLLVVFVIVRIVNAYMKKKRAKERRRAKDKKILEATGLGSVGLGANDNIKPDSALGNTDFGAGQLLVTKYFTMDFEFKDLAMVMKNNDKVIFEGVSGKIKHGRITVIMGCSEDVRLSLLNVFAGRSYRGWVHGQLKVNGKMEDTMAVYHHIIRFVPKSLSMPKELRVSELLRFCAHQSLPRDVSYSLVQKKVQNVMQVFDILECQHDTVGIAKKNGLNDVQRRFLNVAMEVVGEPNALFIEAPVDGLSLNDAKNMVRALKEVAQSGVTVVVLGDRPRNDIFLMYDDVLFLGPNGATIYNGPTRSCLEYFEEIGFKCPHHENPPDFFTDVVLGQVDRPGDPNFIPDKLLHLWELKQNEQNKPWSRVNNELDRQPKPEVPTDDNQDEDLETGDAPLNAEARIQQDFSDKERKRIPIGVMGQYFLFSLRSLLQLVRHLKGIVFDFVFVAAVASIIGGLYFNLEFIGPMATSLQALCPPFIAAQCALPISDKVGIMDLLTACGLAIPAMQSVLKTFGADKHLYRRDADNGMNKLSYFMGKITADLPGFLLFPMLFLSFWYVLIAPLGNFGAYYGIFLLNFWIWTSIGYLISVLVQRTHAELVGVMSIIIAGLLGGINPTIAFMSQQWYTLALVSLSPIRWVTELMYLLEIHVYETTNVNTSTALAYYGYSYDDLWKCIVIAFFFGLGFRILAFLVLYFKDPQTQARFLTKTRVYWRRSKKKLAKLREKRKAAQQGNLGGGYEFHDEEPITQLDVEDSDDEIIVTGEQGTLKESLLSKDDQE
jgi:ABC-type multidrug transport system ATPase subunit